MERSNAVTELDAPVRSASNLKKGPDAARLANVGGVQFTCNSCPYLRIAQTLELQFSMTASDCINVKETLANDGIKVPCGIAAAAVGLAGREGLL